MALIKEYAEDPRKRDVHHIEIRALEACDICRRHARDSINFLRVARLPHGFLIRVKDKGHALKVGFTESKFCKRHELVSCRRARCVGGHALDSERSTPNGVGVCGAEREFFCGDFFPYVLRQDAERSVLYEWCVCMRKLENDGANIWGRRLYALPIGTARAFDIRILCGSDGEEYIGSRDGGTVVECGIGTQDKSVHGAVGRYGVTFCEVRDDAARKRARESRIDELREVLVGLRDGEYWINETCRPDLSFDECASRCGNGDRYRRIQSRKQRQRR